MKGLFYATSMVAMAAVITRAATACAKSGCRQYRHGRIRMWWVLFDGNLSLDGWRGYNKDT